MRRFSQRHSLVTLSDINITPLLDLAFVLLIIFVITTPLLEQGMDLKLPEGGRPTAQLNPRDVQTVEIDRFGHYMLNRRYVTLDQLTQLLVRAYQGDPSLVVYVRADEYVAYKYVAAVMNACTQNGILRLSFRTLPSRRR